MTIRTLCSLGLLSAVVLSAAPGLAQSSRPTDVDVDKVEIKDGKARVQFASSGTDRGVLPGDKGYFVKDGAKVAGSEFTIDRVDDSLGFASTSFKSAEDLRAQTSFKALIAATRTCGRGGARPNLFDSRDVAQGNQPAEGFAFAKVTAAERVHKTRITFTIDKGSDDGVHPRSSGYALLAGPGRPLAQYVAINWVTAKTAGGTVDAGDADKMLEEVKRIGYERVACTPRK